MIQAVIFDVDGLLVDSEPLWREAEVRVFGTVGVRLSPEMQDRTTGLRTDETVRFWRREYSWEGASDEVLGSQIDKTVLSLINERATPKEGVHHIISICEQLDLPMAIASSSSTRIIEAVVSKLGIEKYIEVVESAESEALGKPNPAVYLSTAAKLGVDVHTCLVLEDSINGVLAAKSAGMYCIAVPNNANRNDKRFNIADAIVNSLLEITATNIKSIAS